jgi:hypothetical protein
VGEGGRIWDVTVLIDVEQVGLPMRLGTKKEKEKKRKSKKGSDLSEGTATTCRSRVGQRTLDFQKIDVRGARRRCVQ